MGQSAELTNHLPGLLHEESLTPPHLSDTPTLQTLLDSQPFSQETFGPSARVIPFPAAEPAVERRFELFEQNLPHDLLRVVVPRNATEDKRALFAELERQAPQSLLGDMITSMSKFSRSHLENVLTRAIWNDLGPGLGTQVLNLAVDVMELPAMLRLSGVKQMAAGYVSSYHEVLKHTRLEHSLEVGFNAARMAKKMGLSDSMVMTIAAAGFLHDVGHPPFSHMGEHILADLVTDSRLLAKLGCRGRFDHEDFGASLIKGKAIDRVLQGHSLSSAEVVAVLKHGHPYHPVIDWGDRLSYLARDLLGTTSNTISGSREQFHKRTRIISAIDAFRQGAKQVDGEFVFDGDPRVPEKLLNLRLELLNEVSLKPEVLLVSAFLKREIEQFLKSGRMTVEKFLSHSAVGITERMGPRVRDILEQGVDRAFSSTNIYYAHEFSVKGLERVYNPRFAEEFVNELVEANPQISKSDLLVSVCTEADKRTMVKYRRRDPESLQSEVLQGTYEHKIAPWNRTVAIFISNEVSDEVAVGIAAAVHNHFTSEGMLSTGKERAAAYRRPHYQRLAMTGSNVADFRTA